MVLMMMRLVSTLHKAPERGDAGPLVLYVVVILAAGRGRRGVDVVTGLVLVLVRVAP